MPEARSHPWPGWEASGQQEVLVRYLAGAMARLNYKANILNRSRPGPFNAPMSASLQVMNNVGKAIVEHPLASSQYNSQSCPNIQT